MKKLFGREKPKDQPLQPPVQQTPLTTPIHQQFATRPQSSTDDNQWEAVEQHTPPLPPGASPPVPSPTGARSPSPYTVVPQAKQPPSQQQGQTLRKKTPPVLGILSSLDPVQPHPGHTRNKSEERIQPENMPPPPQKEKEKKGGFWGRGDKDKDRDRERERERVEMEAREREREAREREHRERGREPRRDDENELTRKIGFLTATASEDWTLVLDVCDHASATEANAKEAVRALRREFKYGEPAAQLAAARLWAIMLRNSSDTFISQSTSRKFLDTLEDLLTSSRTSPVVRERVMDVLAAAAYASGTKKDTGFRGLWRRVKPRDKPEEGMPFDTEDAMFNPPLMSAGRPSATYDYDTNSINVNAPPPIVYQDATPIVPDTPPVSRPPPHKRKTSDNNTPGSGENRERPRKGRSHRSRNEDQVIPPDEDMRRLFQECKIGVGNANLLSQALAMATPEELHDSVIVEFHKKCMDSQELIWSQISWATAGAERSREKAEQKERERVRTRKISTNTLNSINPNGNGSVPDLSLSTPVLTREEELLADLLASNEQLLEAIKLYDDLKRVAEEREVLARSQNDRWMDPRDRPQYIAEDGTLHADPIGTGGSSSRSRSASPSPAARVAVSPPVPVPVVMQHPLPSHPQQLEHGMAAYHQPSPPPHPHSQAQLQQQQTLAPPPAAPHGPRSPGAGAGLSRTPSPGHPDLAMGGGVGELANGVGAMRVGAGGYAYTPSSGRGSIDDEGLREREREVSYNSDGEEDEEADERPYQPSAKALGKRKVEVDPYERQPLEDELSLGHKDNLDDRPLDSDDEDTPEKFWAHRLHPAPHFVYDAAAERTAARIREGHVSALIVNGVH
ncbi:hypothetical protein MVEN_02583800 [Mycena venus]|uniref:VHS domain-containing protein n=1 Tax=Mycena venus TaxID=2733690 RepID=A0A8H6U1H4_9AGAR|nr:hypothetical protein MVEN_02583800 [Mycena venus]